MVNKNYKKLSSLQELKWKIFLGFLLLVFLLVSCASAPKPESFYKGRSGFGLMEEGAMLYLTAEVEAVRPILDSLVLGGMTGTEIKDFLDMSDTLTAAVFNIPGERHFYAAALGRFPSARGGLFFSASKDWEKKISTVGMPYWYSSRSRLSISISANAAYLSDGDPFVSAPGAKVPDELAAMQKNSVLSGWINNPAQAINRLVAAFDVPIEIPAERILFAVYPAETEIMGGKKPAAGKGKTVPDRQYKATLRFETPSATQAYGLVMIFSMARMGLAQADFSERKDMEILARAFFSQNPRQDGNALIINTGTMGGKDLALLFNTISIY